MTSAEKEYAAPTGADGVGQYIHVQCEEFALLINILWVEEVINSMEGFTGDAKLEWRGNSLPYIDLTSILTGSNARKNRHCLIMKSAVDAEICLGVGVGQVANIQAIKDNEFEELPNLDFPFNDFFDKVYLGKQNAGQTGGRCIYRLRNLVDVSKRQT